MDIHADVADRYLPMKAFTGDAHQVYDGRWKSIAAERLINICP